MSDYLAGETQKELVIPGARGTRAGRESSSGASAPHENHASARDPQL